MSTRIVEDLRIWCDARIFVKEIYDLINEFKSSGKAVIMISSEMPEILGLSDRILVLSQGVITGEFDIKDASQEAILKCAVETKEAI